MWLLEESLSVVLGLALWALALWIPMRRFASRPELAWDVLGALATALLGALAAFAFLYAYGSAMEVDWVWDWTESIERVPPWELLLLNVVFADFAGYWAHRALHTRWLWNSHAWHHSPKVLYWLSGLRASPGHVAVLYAPAALVFVCFPTPETGAVALASILIDVINQHFIHSNIRVPWAKPLERIFVTPRFHFVHHSTTIARSNSNYGFLFSFWDRLFGTYTDPDTVPENDPLGLGYEIGKGRLLLGLPPPREPAGIRAEQGETVLRRQTP